MHPVASCFLSHGPDLVSLNAALAAAGMRFITVTPATHARVNARAENARARSVEDVFGWSRPFGPDVLPPALLRLAVQANAVMPDADAGLGYRRACVRAASLEGLLLLHSAYPTTAPDAVFFGPDTYRFAHAVRHHLAHRPAPLHRALDIGCGTGAAGLLIARACPTASVLMTDINPTAVAAARINAQANELANVVFAQADLFEGVQGDFDLIVANPPYMVDPLSRAYRHGGGRLGAHLSLAIARAALARLAPGGSLILYTGSAIMAGQDLLLEALRPVMRGFEGRCSYHEIDPDVFGEELETGAARHADRIAAVLFEAERAL